MRCSESGRPGVALARFVLAIWAALGILGCGDSSSSAQGGNLPDAQQADGSGGADGAADDATQDGYADSAPDHVVGDVGASDAASDSAADGAEAQDGSADGPDAPGWIGAEQR